MKERKLICAEDDGWVKDDEFPPKKTTQFAHIAG